VGQESAVSKLWMAARDSAKNGLAKLLEDCEDGDPEERPATDVVSNWARGCAVENYARFVEPSREDYPTRDGSEVGER